MLSIVNSVRKAGRANSRLRCVFCLGGRRVAGAPLSRTSGVPASPFIGIQYAHRQTDRSVFGPAQVHHVRKPAIRMLNPPHAGIGLVGHDLQQDTAAADRPSVAVVSPVKINPAEDVTDATVLAHGTRQACIDDVGQERHRPPLQTPT
jgi:hypothetical protein